MPSRIASFVRRAVTWLAYGIAAIVALLFLVVLVTDTQRRFRERENFETAAPATGRFITTSLGKVFIQEAGPSTGPAVMLFHAAGGWSETWRPTLDTLAKKGFRAVAVDLPPLGYSERIPGMSYAKKDQALRIREVLDALKIQRVTLVGHSFSSGITMETLFLYPERVRSLVLVDSVLSLKEADEPVPRNSVFGMLFAFKPLRFAFVESAVTQPLFTKSLLKRFIYDPSDATDELVDLYQKPQRVEGVSAAVTDWLPSVVAPEYSLASQADLYKKISVPTLIIWGKEDTTTPLVIGETLAALIPGARLEVMESVGHLPPQEDSESFNTLLINFLTH